MEKDDLNILFEDFKNQVIEISKHSDKVKKLDFSCSLLNGTGFKFNYDINKYNKETVKYKPATTFNAVVDILSALVSIAFLVLYISNYFKIQNENSITNLFVITLLIASIGFFVLRAVYHLFHATSSVRNPLFRVSEGFKIILILNLNTLVSIIYKIDNITLVVFLSFIVCSLALLCMGIGTKGAFKIEMLLTSLLPFFMLVSTTTLAIISSATMLCISSFIYIVMDGKEAKTNSIFTLLGLSLFVLGIFSLI
ncbi:MAG: hypothetical protein PQJ45_04755 [Sphaerochaetaceae bacterium]|nr:hypothetical protein [Sphaerochaetaceae bacterium]MDC7237064.1 hypothetical protein [Sphaerochaetaceae bacterium]